MPGEVVAKEKGSSRSQMKQSEIDNLLILKNQQVIMKALFVVMKSMAGDMTLAEELKEQAKSNYDYIAAREDN